MQIIYFYFTESERETPKLENLTNLTTVSQVMGFLNTESMCAHRTVGPGAALWNVCGVGGASQLKLVLPPDPKQRVTFMSLQSKGLWNMSPSSKQHVRMMQATGKDKCKPQEHRPLWKLSGK